MREGVVRHPGVRCTVKDTVGAGDAFTAALCVHRLLGYPPHVQAEAANRWGAWVASQSGAMPELPESTLRTMEQHIRDAGSR
jgi:fructokinase